LKYHENYDIYRFNPSEQLYLRDGRRFTLVKVSKLRSKDKIGCRKILEIEN